MMIYAPILRTCAMFLLACTTSCNTDHNSTNPGNEQESTAPSAVLKRQWKLLSFGGDTSGFATMYPTQVPHIVIDSAQSGVYGNTGCNAFGGTAKVKGDSLRFITPFEMTAIGCPGEGEEKFTRSMARVSGYLMKGDTLVLLERDIPLMSFIKKP